MKKTGTLVLLLILMATGLLAQPNPATDGAFNCYQYVGTASEAIISGQFPDGEVGIDYDGAHVVFKDGNLTAPVGYYVITYYFNGPPPGIVKTDDLVMVGGVAVCQQSRLVLPPTTAGAWTGLVVRAGYKKLAGYPAAWPDTWYGPEQYFDFTIQPTGYGVVYPPLLGGGGGSGSDGGGGGDDGGCSTVAGVGLGVPTTLSAILGAFLWRRRREE